MTNQQELIAVLQRARAAFSISKEYAAKGDKDIAERFFDEGQQLVAVSTLIKQTIQVAR